MSFPGLIYIGLLPALLTRTFPIFLFPLKISSPLISQSLITFATPIAGIPAAKEK
jgi:hypothetical protein